MAKTHYLVAVPSHIFRHLAVPSMKTMGSAYASFEEKSKGSIEIANARVVMTVFDGQIIYERP